jgi:hypothetical protein
MPQRIPTVGGISCGLDRTEIIKTEGEKTLNIRTRHFAFVCFLITLIGPTAAHAQTKAPSPVQNLEVAKGSYDVGLIFNTSSILLDLESYQAGIGLKVGRDKLSFRGLFDLVLNGASDSFSLNGGAALQYYTLPGPVSPYVGGSAGGGYMRQGNAMSMVVLSIGALAGVEVFLFDFLSVFAEYAITADFTISTDLASSLTTFDYLVNTGMGNNSKLGIVIYFMRAMKKK